MKNTFRELRYFLSGIWGHQCIIFRDQGRTDPPGGLIIVVSLKWTSVWNLPNEPVHEISNNVVYATSKGSDQPAHTRSLIRAFASRLNIL